MRKCRLPADSLPAYFIGEASAYKSRFPQSRFEFDLRPATIFRCVTVKSATAEELQVMSYTAFQTGFELEA